MPLIGRLIYDEMRSGSERNGLVAAKGISIRSGPLLEFADGLQKKKRFSGAPAFYWIHVADPKCVNRTAERKILQVYYLPDSIELY